ncbi:MAG: hypothetical protein KY463_02475, partial [Actinobacteria bacterium]|nr:hypothetical protein [Actinomycetota bacterium]
DSVSAERKIVGSLRATGLRPTFLDKFEKRNVKLPANLFQTSNGHAPGSMTPMAGRAAQR